MATNSSRARVEAPAQTIAAPVPPESQPVQDASAAPRPEPMTRYVHPIPQSAHVGSSRSGLQTQVCLEHILEALMRQNQLLLDLLAATNSLSAAVLTPRPDSRRPDDFS